MNIDIHESKLEMLIEERMATGQFSTVEDALVQALESSPLPEELRSQSRGRTGADLVAAMQAMPYKDEVDFEHLRSEMPVRDVQF